MHAGADATKSPNKSFCGARTFQEVLVLFGERRRQAENEREYEALVREVDVEEAEKAKWMKG
jgi:hypothetical protein